MKRVTKSMILLTCLGVGATVVWKDNPSSILIHPVIVTPIGKNYLPETDLHIDHHADLKAWAEQDPAAALTWLFQQPEAVIARDMEEAWAGAAKQPRVALEVLRRLQSVNPQAHALQGGYAVIALTQAGHADLAMAHATSEGMTAQEARDWPCGILANLTKTTPEAAVNLWKTMPVGRPRDLAWESIARQWADQVPAALCAYAITLPESALERSVALQLGAAQWLARDPVTYTAWLQHNNLPEEIANPTPPSLRQGAEEALGMIEAEPDSGRRISLARSVVEQWAHQSPEEARQWLGSTKWLSAGERASLLQNTFRPDSGGISERK